jgi:hypothetical protein
MVPRAWLPAALAVALAIVVAACQLWMAHDLVTLPSPLYGGDYVYQMGCIRSIAASGNPMASCSTCGALPGYLPLYGTVVALVAHATGLEVVRAMLVMSAVLRALSVLIVYWVFADLFGGPAGLAMAGLWAMLNPSLLLKYTEFTAGVVIPLYVHALFRTVAAPRPVRALVLGVTLAVAGYAHAVAFVGGLAVAFLALLAAMVWRAVRAPASAARELGRTALALTIVLACCLLALGYWYRPIVVDHGRTSAHYTEWNGGPALATLSQRVDYTGRQLGSMLRFDDAAHAALSLLVLAAAVALFHRRTRARVAPGVLVAACTFVWLLHYLVTEPVLHTHFVPNYVRRVLWDFVVLLVAVVPVVALFDAARGAAGRALQVAMLAGAVVVLTGETRALAASGDLARARLPHPPAFTDLQRWALAHTRPDDIVLSTNELSFAWSALTGRKCLVTRRAQNDAFVDMDERNRDAALILYGRDDGLRRARLRRWGVGYLLWTDGWTLSEWQPDAQGRSFRVDPLLWFRNDSAAAALARAGVHTSDDYGWVDPALRGDEYQAFDLTCVTASNYESAGHPWRRELDPLLEEVWTYREQGRRTAALYRVKP